MSEPVPLRENAKYGNRHAVNVRDMLSMPDLAEDEARAMERIALGIFTDMSNAGHSLQATLAAIYLSGFTAAVDILAEAKLLA